MNKIFRLTSATLAVVALASCSNDDFFGNNSDYVPASGVTIDVTVEQPNVTRANAYGNHEFDWQVGDELRVYDNLLQKFDNFAFMQNGSEKVFTRTNSDPDAQFVDVYVDEADATKNAYALFGGGNAAEGNKVSYAGWKQDNGGEPVALVNIPATINHLETTKSDDASVLAYKAAIPMWGRVSAPATEKATFSAKLNWLTAFVAAKFENANKLDATKSVKAVRARSLKVTDAFNTLSSGDQTKLKAKIKKDLVLGTNTVDLGATIGAITGATHDFTSETYATYLTATGAAPLCGWFDAHLVENGKMVNPDNADGAVQQPATRNIITVNTTNLLTKNTSKVYIPIIAQKYDLLVVEYTTTDPEVSTPDKWTIMGAVKGIDIPRGAPIEPTKDFDNVSNVLDGTTTYNITDKIASVYGDGSRSAIINFNVDATGASQTGIKLTVASGSAVGNTIYLPKIDQDLTISIQGDATVMAADLNIADLAGVDNSTSTGKVTIDIKSFANDATTAAKSVNIASKANIVLTGDYTNLTTPLKSAATSKVTLGVAGDSPVNFQTGTKTISIDKGDLTVAAVDDALTVNYTGAGNINVNDKVTTVTIGKDAASATVKGDVTTQIATAKDITINGNAATTSIKKLVLSKTVSSITLKQGIIEEIAETATEADQYAVNAPIAISSEGLSAIKKIDNFAKAVKWNITSKFTVPSEGTKTMNYFESLASAGPANIYTAAQLAAINDVGTEEGQAKHANVNGFTLKTNITELKNWASPALTKNFNGGKAASNGLTIKGVDAPLFGEVSTNVAISNVDLTVNISKEAANIGALAKTTGADDTTDDDDVIAVTNVAIAGTIGGQNNVGGVFGKTGTAAVVIGGLLSLSDEERAANKVAVNVTLNNTTAITDSYNGTKDTYGTFGKFIGQAGTGIVVITSECTEGTVWTAANKKALHFNYNRLRNADTGLFEWQFIGNGDLIGYSPDAKSLTYGGKTYTNTWTDPYSTDDDKKIKYASKKVTGTVRIINSEAAVGTSDAWYTTKNAAFKNKMKSVFSTLSSVAADADWSGLTVEVHNLWEAYSE